jgi:hypothetical protein
VQHEVLLRRTGTVSDAAFRYGPGSAAHHAAPDDAPHRRGGVMRSIRGTQQSIFVTRVGRKIAAEFAMTNTTLRFR